MKKIFSGLLISFLMLIGLTSVNAINEPSVIAEVILDEEVKASDLDVSEPRVLPGHPFYFIKDWTRNIKSVMTFDPVKKASLEAEFANEKLIELRKMTESNMSKDSLEEAINSYKERIQKTEELTAKIEAKAGEDENVKDFSDQFTQQQILHDKILLKLEQQVPENVLEKIKEAREEHIDRFQNTLLNVEDIKNIPEKLIQAFDKIEGSDFKAIKDVELLNRLKEKLPEEITEDMEDRMNERIETFKERMENLPIENQEKFQKYISNITGDKETYLNIIDNIGGRVLSEDFKKIIDTVREKSLQQIKDGEGINLDSGNLQREFNYNEDLLEKVKTLILEKGLDKSSMPEIFQFVENAELDLDKAKEYLEEGNYSDALGEIKSSFSLSKNTENLIKRIAGYDIGSTSTNPDNQAITCNDSINIPICGTDGVTYRNICEAQKVNIKIAYRGECQNEEMVCAKVNEQVNRNPFIGSTNQKCCDGLEEFRVSKSYSVCKNSDSKFECVTSADCPLSTCAGEMPKCEEGKCIMPQCSNGTSCIQVITPAVNSDGTCKEFPTPCDVPEGWTLIDECESGSIQLKDSARQEQIKIQTQARIDAVEALKIEILNKLNVDENIEKIEDTINDLIN